MKKLLPNWSTFVALLIIMIAWSLLISHFYPLIALVIAIFSPISALAVGTFITWWYKESENIFRG